MKKISILIPALMLMMFWSCSREKFVVPGEASKSVDGTWKIVKALRNGTDLTSRFDFSHFSITFKDSSYSIDSLVPFAVEKNGTYRLDDPQYPFRMYIKQQDSSEKPIDIQYPFTDGVRSIVISFSPGCTSNTYQYTLQKIN